MKKLLLILLLVAPAFAGTVVSDQANLLDGQTALLSDILKPYPVWFESRVNVPDGNVRAYADRRVAELTKRGFLIVITTSPREWRISMSPHGLVSGEATRPIGEKMVPFLRRGDVRGAVAHAAPSLSALLATPQVEQVVAAKPKPVLTPEQQREQLLRRIAANKAWEAEQEAERWHDTLIAGVVVGLVVLLIAYAIWSTRRERARAAEARREWQADLDRIVADREKRREEREKRESQRRLEEGRKAQSEISAARWDSEKSAAAQTAFSRYSEDERRAMANRARHSPYYEQGAWADPIHFYMLLWMTGVFDNHGNTVPQPPSAQPNHSSSTDDTTRKSSSSTDSYTPPPSSYDGFGSGGGFSSSSDSSGSGGSW